MYIFRMPPLFEPLKEKFFCKGSSTKLSREIYLNFYSRKFKNDEFIFMEKKFFWLLSRKN